VQKSKVISIDSTDFLSQNPKRNLACFQPEFGILKIGRKNQKGGHPAAFSFGGEPGLPLSIASDEPRRK
jgi:hypothetical protein